MIAGAGVRRALVGIAVAVLVMLVPAQAWAAPGDPDTGFSSDGFQTLDFPGDHDDQANAVLVQADGRIVLGGWTQTDGAVKDFGLARVMGNGSIDTSFSGDGFRALDFRGVGGSDTIYDLVQQPDGKIVAVGEAYNADGSKAGFAVARFRANGTLDTSFSGDGKILVNFPGMDYAFAYAVARQANGKILVGGETGDDGSTDWDFAVLRLNSNGTIDTTYGGGDGRIVTNFAGNYDGIWDMVLDEDGRLVAAGWSRNTPGTNYRHGYARYTAAGTLDHSFSTDGKQVVDVSADANDEALGVEIRGDGKIVAAGGIGGPDISLVRLNPGGTPDTTFSGDGKLISEPLAGGTYASDLDLATGDKLIVAGYTPLDEFFLARYMPGGAMDATFGGGDGFIVWLVPGSSESRAYRSALQTNGRIVIAGYAMVDTKDFAVARFLP